MKSMLGFATLAALVLAWTGSTTEVAAAEQHANSGLRGEKSAITDISARRRHHHHWRHARHYRPLYAFHRPFYRPYYRTYPVFTAYRPYRPFYRPYPYYRPVFYGSPYYYNPYYGPRTFVSIGPFSFGFGGYF